MGTKMVLDMGKLSPGGDKEGCYTGVNCPLVGTKKVLYRAKLYPDGDKEGSRQRQIVLWWEQRMF